MNGLATAPPRGLPGGTPLCGKARQVHQVQTSLYSSMAEQAIHNRQVASSNLVAGGSFLAGARRRRSNPRPNPGGGASHAARK